MAIELKNDEVISLLLSSNKININMPNQTIVKLTKNNDDQSCSIVEETALTLSIRNENINIIKKLLSNDSIDINIKSISREMIYPLIIDFSKESNLYIKASETFNEKTALFLAVEKGNAEIVNLLLSNNKIDINYPNITMKRILIEEEEEDYDEWIEDNDKNDMPCIKTIEKEPITKNNKIIKEMSPLHQAVLNENAAIIQLLINNKNININKRDEKGNKPVQLTEKDDIKKLFFKKK